jgi:hypothetical protein
MGGYIPGFQNQVFAAERITRRQRSGYGFWEGIGAQEDMDERQKQMLAEFLDSCRAEGRSQQALLGLRHRVPKLFAYSSLPVVPGNGLSAAGPLFGSSSCSSAIVEY